MTFAPVSLVIQGGAAFVLLAAWVSLASAAERPNIVFIFTDDHAAHAMSCYGSRVNETPHMDRIAAEGMKFENCFCTNSLCGPSRAVILTGKHSHLNGFRQNGDQFDGSQQTFPKLMQEGGYQTAVIGKWHLGTEPTGFDYSEVLVGQGPYYNPPMIRNGERTKYTGYTTEIITNLALEWLGNGRNQEKPFMLMLQHKAPHREWQPGPRQYDLYKNVDLPEPATLFDNYEGRGTAAKTQDMTIEKTLTELDLKLVPPKNLTEEQLAAWHAAYDAENEEFRQANLQGKDLVRWKYQRYMKDYLRCVAAVDDSIGEVMEFLDESGLAENTIVIYSSDQGFYLGEHGCACRCSSSGREWSRPEVRTRTLFRILISPRRSWRSPVYRFPRPCRDGVWCRYSRENARRIGARRFITIITNIPRHMRFSGIMGFGRIGISSFTFTTSTNGNCMIWSTIPMN